MLRTATTICLALLALTAGTATATAAPSPYRHDLLRVENALRTAIEDAPVALGEGMLSSEVVCKLAERNEANGAGSDAAANWSTLSQLADQVDMPAVEKVDRAFARAESLAASLRRTYAAAWRRQGDTRAVGRLNSGVDRVRDAIGRVQAATAQMAAALPAWREHDCAAAVNAIETGVGRVPGAIERLNWGMVRLWTLAEEKSD